MSLHRIGDKLYLNPPGAAGKTVEIAPNDHGDAERLVAAERQGDFYAITAVNHLKALTTGFGGKHNVFISDSGSFRANTYQEVQIYVPNISAKVERRDDDTLVIYDIRLSPEFGNLEAARNNKPGIYSVSGSATAKPKYSDDGRIKEESYRPVVIADPRFKKPEDAAEEIGKRLSKLCGDTVAGVGDFDFFYSPYGKMLDGKRCFDATKATEVYAYAGLLADAIEAAKDQHGVIWSSDRGGSVVLTQALQALRLKQQMLGNGMPMFTKDNVHIVKMHKAYNDPYVTYNAAKSLGMKTDAKILASAHGAHAKLKTIAGNIARIAREKDPHIKTGTLISVGGSTENYISATGALVTTASLLVPGGMPILTVAGTAITGYGALSLWYKVWKDRKDGE